MKSLSVGRSDVWQRIEANIIYLKLNVFLLNHNGVSVEFKVLLNNFFICQFPCEILELHLFDSYKNY